MQKININTENTKEKIKTTTENGVVTTIELNIEDAIAIMSKTPLQPIEALLNAVKEQD